MNIRVTRRKRNGQPLKKAVPPEVLLAEIGNNSDAPLIARELLAIRKEREKKGQPDRTIEQIFEELD
ncbi:MAG TPA: hypothetical protein VNQ79_21675 [Blastocatellia bacterium]|nr:hypothetical protein [Blastocatellia bacterium]